MPEISLLKNGGFEDDVEGWTASGGVTLEHDDEMGDAYSGGCGKATFERGEAPGLVSQDLAGSITPSIASRGVSFAARVQADAAGAVFPWISEDGGVTKQYGYPNGIASGAGAPDADPSYETLTVAGYALTTAADAVSCGLEFRTSTTAYIDNVTLVLGVAAVPYQDCVTPELLAALTGSAPTSRRTVKKPDYPASGREAGAGVPTATSSAPQTVSPGGSPLLPRPGVSLPIPEAEQAEPPPEPAPAPEPAQPSAPAPASSGRASRSSS